MTHFFYKLFVLILGIGIFFLLGNVSFASSESFSGIPFHPFAGFLMLAVMLFVIWGIATEALHRTLLVFIVSTGLIFISYTLGSIFPDLNLLTFEQAFASIDGEVIFLLMGMMIIVGIIGQTRFFEWIAFQLFKISKGSIITLFFLFFLITAVLSAFLDNVTTIFFITPVAISLSKIFKLNPVRLVVSLIIASNIGGAATLIGDPPNIMIGSYAGLSFSDFIMNMGLPIIVILVAVMGKLYFILKPDFEKTKKIHHFDRMVEEMSGDYKIQHKKLLRSSLLVLLGVILFFFLHGMFHMPAAVPALAGAGILMYLRDKLIRKKFGKEAEHMTEAIEKTFAKDIEWLVIGFFLFLFMIIGAVEQTGILNVVAESIQSTFSDNLFLCALVILWVSALFSAFLDNIPFTAVMLPVVGSLVQFYGPEQATFLWWALAFGACLGGNGTLIGASANIIAGGILHKEKYKLTFWEYFKIGFPSMIFQISLASGALYVMYLF